MRVNLIEQLYSKKKSALEFNYDSLRAPPILSIFTQYDINELYRIASSVRYASRINEKYKMIDAIMNRRGFIKAHSGTNRVVYNYLEDHTFVAKVAIDRVGLKDTPAEFKNQEYFKPFCCKIFEVDPTGVIGFVERVNPITSLEEFASVSDDIFNMMITKIIGKYVVDDLGAEKFMNYGLRQDANGHTFGPVIIDFPYAYELDGNKMICQKPILTQYGLTPCGGDIDYDSSLSHLKCNKCGKEYKAIDLMKNQNIVKFIKGDEIPMNIVVSKNGKLIAYSGRSSNMLLPEEDIGKTTINIDDIDSDIIEVKNTKRYSNKKPKEETQMAERIINIEGEEYIIKSEYDKLASNEYYDATEVEQSAINIPDDPINQEVENTTEAEPAINIPDDTDDNNTIQEEEATEAEHYISNIVKRNTVNNNYNSASTSKDVQNIINNTLKQEVSINMDNDPTIQEEEVTEAEPAIDIPEVEGTEDEDEPTNDAGDDKPADDEGNDNPEEEVNLDDYTDDIPEVEGTEDEPADDTGDEPADTNEDDITEDEFIAKATEILDAHNKFITELCNHLDGCRLTTKLAALEYATSYFRDNFTIVLAKNSINTTVK